MFGVEPPFDQARVLRRVSNNPERLGFTKLGDARRGTAAEFLAPRTEYL
jgi:hypothetical protein